ncbi:MAG: response regulator [Bacteroidales bacterium]|nr:response regulator [Bacteroidales bacterium]
MEFERRLKIKTIFTVMIVLFVLCALYFTLGIKNQKQYIDWQIQKENEIVNIEIKNLLQTTNQLYRDKIQYFVNNPEIKKEFQSNNIDKLYRRIFPFYTILKSEDPYHFVVSFYTKDNRLALNMETGSGNIHKSAAQNSIVFTANKEKRKKTGFEFVNSLLYYKIAEPVVNNGEYIGCIEFAIRENEIVDHITKKFDVTIASLFNTENLNRDILSEFKSSVVDNKYLIHSLFDKGILAEVVKKNQSLTPGKFKFNEKHYYLDVINIENSFRNEGFEGVVYTRDISVLQNQFQAILYRSLLIIFLILISTYIILHFSFNTLIRKVFNLQDSLDKRLAQKTKEVLNTNAELTQIFNTTGNSMRLIDSDFNILRVNRTFTMMSGISKEDAEGKKCFNVFPGPYCHTAECPLNQIKNGEDRIEQDIKKKNKQGKVIPGILNSVAFKGQNGEILGIIEDFKDITQRVEAEEALQKTEQQFSIFMDNLPLGVFIKDENFKSVYLNKYMDYIFSNANCQNKTPEEIFPKEYAQRVIEEDKRVLNGEVLVVEDQLPNNLGELKSYQTHKFRFRGVDNLWQIGGISLDITQKKKTEYELINAKEKAEESNRLKTTFLANLSHEIRTPMNAIIGFSNLLLDDEMLHEEKVKLNKLINDNSQNLLKLIDDVIDISKIQSGDIQFNKTECYLNKLLLDLYVSFSIQIENDTKKDIHLSMHKGSKIKDFSIITDPIRLKQILYNLIENAIKFTIKGFVEFGYTIIEEKNQIQFYVIDSGIGISNDKFDMIYDLFRQADESFTREYGGTGIGLTIARKIVDHLGGDIWVQSTPDQGTNIYFTLPYELNESKFVKAEENIENTFDWQNKVVLVADDIDVNYKLIEEILSPTKAKVLWAKDGKEAVDLCLNNDNIDLVLMDIRMPGMDGIEATQKIKEHKSELQIIGQTAFAHDNDREKCLNAGFDNYISKPIKIETLLTTINKVFSKN